MCRPYFRDIEKKRYMAKNYFDRYVWLINTIDRHGHISKEDIDELWYRSPLNEKRDKKLPERTFHNHREAILETFGIEIKCDRSLGYYIANSEDLEADGIRHWLLESLSMNNMLNETRDMQDRILFEKVPSSQKWLPVIVNAMRDGKAVELTYQSFWKDEPATFVAHPYCLKLFKQRWYVLARSEDFEDPWVYALDERMQNVAPVKQKLKMPLSFDAASFFADYFGVTVGKNINPVEIKLAVDSDQVRFFESLPLHSSQKKVEEESTDKYTVFSYRLAPTYDFRQEVLRHGADVEVLAPEAFRQEIADQVKAMAKRYGV